MAGKMSSKSSKVVPSSDRHSADSHDLIRVQGARVNNLKDVSIEIPKRRLTVFTGVSGSGKSSLVFGTIAGVTAAQAGPASSQGRYWLCWETPATQMLRISTSIFATATQ
jgi:ABC-type transport system involved in cytochrome bd biosynthesis fused ATPase/permease subunit